MITRRGSPAGEGRSAGGGGSRRHSQTPRGSSRAATISRNTPGPGTAKTRTTAPTTTPGSVPSSRSRVSGLARLPRLRYRSSAPGPDTTLNSRFVGVTAGFGTSSTLSWTGSRNTAPETPTGVVRTEITSPATTARSASAQVTAPVCPAIVKPVPSTDLRPGTRLVFVTPGGDNSDLGDEGGERRRGGARAPGTGGLRRAALALLGALPQIGRA